MQRLSERVRERGVVFNRRTQQACPAAHAAGPEGEDRVLAQGRALPQGCPRLAQDLARPSALRQDEAPGPRDASPAPAARPPGSLLHAAQPAARLHSSASAHRPRPWPEKKGAHSRFSSAGQWQRIETSCTRVPRAWQWTLCSRHRVTGLERVPDRVLLQLDAGAGMVLDGSWPDRLVQAVEATVTDARRTDALAQPRVRAPGRRSSRRAQSLFEWALASRSHLSSR